MHDLRLLCISPAINISQSILLQMFFVSLLIELFEVYCHCATFRVMASCQCVLSKNLDSLKLDDEYHF